MSFEPANDRFGLPVDPHAQKKPTVSVLASGFDTGQNAYWESPDNTKEWKCFFLYRGVAPKWSFPVSLRWVREIGSQERFGWGLGVRLLRGIWVGGVWWPRGGRWFSGVGKPLYEAAEVPPTTKENKWRFERNIRRPDMPWVLYKYYERKERRRLAREDAALAQQVQADQEWYDNLEKYAVPLSTDDDTDNA